MSCGRIWQIASQCGKLFDRSHICASLKFSGKFKLQQFVLSKHMAVYLSLFLMFNLLFYINGIAHMGAKL